MLVRSSDVDMVMVMITELTLPLYCPAVTAASFADLVGEVDQFDNIFL